MKITKKNFPLLIQILLLTAIIGTVIWAILAVIFEKIGIDMHALAGSIGFDAYIISFKMKLNPGTIIGLISGVLIFLRV